jgi:hypothetical protein
MNKKRPLYFAIIFVSVLIVTFLIIFLIQPVYCADGTKYRSCSNVKPYFCSQGKLIEKSSVCGCPISSQVQGETCFSEYQFDSKNITLNYTLRGKQGNIDFVVYKGMEDYLSKLPRQIDSTENLTLADFKLRMINEETQSEFLFPLFLKIASLTSSKEDRARIAISLVQNIPFGSSDKIIRVGNIPIGYQRYPYEVLYDMQGICSEKSELLLFLLREIGYGTASLYYNAENHEAVGIKCPISESVINSGYCFVETTGPSIISDDQTDYFGTSKKLNSTPQVIGISDGISLSNNIIEYRDANSLINIRNNMKRNGEINFFDSITWNAIKKRYGLVSFGHYEF